MRSSLTQRLMSAFLLVISIAALVMYFLTSSATRAQFRIYATRNSQILATRLAPDFAEYYGQVGSWRGVITLMDTVVNATSMTGMMGGGRGRGYSLIGGMQQRLILADEQGMVIADTSDQLTGSRLSAAELASGAPVNWDSQPVGTLVVTPGDERAGPNPASAFLAAVNRSVLISVAVAGLLSLLLAVLVSVQITAPIRQMRAAAGAIARGDLRQRVPVRSRDELGALSESFNEMAGSLAEAETQRRELIADVAHELRTPLAAIRANVEGMQDGVLPVDLEQVNAIHAETLLLGRLIEDLRLLSLAEAGELRLERGPAVLADLLQGAVDRFQPESAQKGVRLVASVEPGLPQVSVDVDRINQVINNLISNALRYTPPGGVIALEARQESGAVRVSVSDSGPGVSADDLPRIFDRFYRADKSRARQSGGSGLGLAIVRQLVEAHGGSVQAESPIFEAEGRRFGTRISFTLPG